VGEWIAVLFHIKNIPDIVPDAPQKSHIIESYPEAYVLYRIQILSEDLIAKNGANIGENSAVTLPCSSVIILAAD
jgi:hypothetical protein